MLSRSSSPIALLVLAGIHATAFAQAPAPAAEQPRLAADTLIKTIAFGSCAKQDRPQPIWDAINDQKPDVFLFIGDNIYGDSDDMNVLREKYAKLAAVPGFAMLRAQCPLLATWDDHDYGRNDAGADYAQRDASQQVFLDFLGEPATSPRRTRPGIYHEVSVGPEGKRVQFILLDTRYFRSPLEKHGRPVEPADGAPGPYTANDDPEATVLGDAQWKWLDEQLRKPAELRILASSIQVVAEEQNYEKWANFPRERARLLRLIAETGAGGVIFISGDRHAAELSYLRPGGDGKKSADGKRPAYPLYDLTSSALNQKRGFQNRHRLGSVYFEPNFGTIEIDWDQSDPRVSLCIRDEQGKLVIRGTVRLSEIGRKSQG